MATKQTVQANADMQKEILEKQSMKAKLLENLKKEEKVEVSGSPFYKPYFGGNMPIMISGIAVYVPLDGRPHKIPASFAQVFNERIARIDMHIEKLEALNVVEEEQFAGDSTSDLME